MNKLVKIVPIVVILVSLGSLYYIQRLANARDQLKTEKAALETANLQLSNDLDSTTKQRDAAAESVTQLQADLDLSQSNLESAQLTIGEKTKHAQELQIRVTDLQAALDGAKEKLASAEVELQKAQEEAKNADLKQNEELQAELAAVAAENKLLARKLTSMRSQRGQLENQIEGATPTPVGLRGSISAIERNWDFVVLDVGEREQVQPNTEFLIYRKDDLIGKVQVVTVTQTASIAELLPEYRRGKPKVGDFVIH